MFLLDTNAVSDIFKGTSPAARKSLAEAQTNTQVAFSVISKAEILFGLANRPDALAFRAAFNAFSANVDALPWNDSAAQSYAELRSSLKARQRTVETMDLLIAAQAHALGAVLVTRDKGFRHLEGLIDVVNWSTDLRNPR